MDDSLKSDYKKYARYIIPLFVGIYSMIMIFQVMAPQFFSMQDAKDKIEVKKENLKKMSDDLSFVQSVSDEFIDKQLAIADNAYPSYGDIISVYNGIFSAALKTNVSIKSFSITPGYVYQRNEGSAPVTKDVSLPILISVKISAQDSRSIVFYGRELYKVLPLFEVTNVKYDEKDVSYNISAFKKPYDIKTLSKIGQVKQITTSQKQLIKQLEEWKTNTENTQNKQINIPVSTLSGQLKIINNQ